MRSKAKHVTAKYKFASEILFYFFREELQLFLVSQRAQLDQLMDASRSQKVHKSRAFNPANCQSTDSLQFTIHDHGGVDAGGGETAFVQLYAAAMTPTSWQDYIIVCLLRASTTLLAFHYAICTEIWLQIQVRHLVS